MADDDEYDEMGEDDNDEDDDDDDDNLGDKQHRRLFPLNATSCSHHTEVSIFNITMRIMMML